MSLEIHSSSVEMTEAVGRSLGGFLMPGDVLLLQGELGSGKTAFAMGIAAGLGIEERVKSPSFILVSQYRGRLGLYHADLYRLTTPAEAAELGLDDQAREGVLVVEWPERAMRELPEEHLLALFSHEGEDGRRLVFSGVGQRAALLVSKLEEEFP